jgi:hypothetical protein
MGKREKKQISSIDLLPDAVRSQLQALLADRKMTQLEVVRRINATLATLSAAGQLPAEAPESLSKSALNRYAVRMEEVGAKLRQSREVAEMFIGHVGAAPQGQMGLLINEMLRSMAFELSLKMQDIDLENPETMSATIDQVKALALAVQRLEQSTSINVKREGEIRKLALANAADAVEKAAVQQGLNAEQAAFWRQQVLGVQ